MNLRHGPKPAMDALSKIGARTVNEDSFRLWQRGGRLIALVADGLGGQGGGDAASSLAAETMLPFLAAQPRWDETVVQQAFDNANSAILALQQSKHGRMMTTLVLLLWEKNRFFVAHAGDSRLYLFRDRRVIHQTQDHSVAQLAVLTGEIPLAGIRHHPDRSGVLRALGAAPAVQADLASGVPRAGDQFLLCTDGFWEHVLEAEMEADLCKAATPEAWLNLLYGRVAGRAGPEADNLTAAAVFC